MIESWDQVKEIYPHAKRYKQAAPPATGQNPAPQAPIKWQLTCVQHAELTIAVRMISEIERLGYKGTIPLGVSKSSCYWCREYLRSLNIYLGGQGKEIVWKASHNKMTEGWLLPFPARPSVNGRMEQAIGDKVDEIIAHVSRHRRLSSDSMPLPIFSTQETLTWPRAAFLPSAQ